MERLAPKEEEAFVIGGEEDEEQTVDDGSDGGKGRRRQDDYEADPPPPYEASCSLPLLKVDAGSIPGPPTTLQSSAQTIENGHPVHYVQKTDTLRGLALKYGVDVRRR